MMTGSLNGITALKRYPCPLDNDTMQLLARSAGKPASSGPSAGIPAGGAAPTPAGKPAVEVQQAQFAKALVWSVTPLNTTNLLLAGDSSMNFKVSRYIDNKQLCAKVAELLEQPTGNYWVKLAKNLNADERNFVFHNSFRGGAIIELDALITQLEANLPELNVRYPKGSPLEYKLEFPFWNQQNLNEEWGIVILLWQFNDLNNQSGN